MFSIWRKEITIKDFSTRITMTKPEELKPDSFVHETYAWLDVLYLTFMFLATFCMAKMTFDLPLLFSPAKALRVEGVSSLPVESQKAFLLLGDEGLLNTHSFVIIAFFLLRLMLHLMSGNKMDPFQSKLEYMKTVWNKTLVVWGVLFGMISSLGVFWNG